MIVNIREAIETDIPKLCTLLAILFEKEAEFSANIQLQQVGLQAIISNKQIGKIYVIQEDDTIVGMVSLLFSISTALGGKVAWLEDMIIAHEAQNKGYGSRLIKYTIDEAKRLACKRITLLSDADNDAAHRFYSRFGFEYSLMQPLRLIL
ncbi:MAG: GNAT family N-acetyltransferase [Sulfurospirillaceae bacterium]|nr:GNAT family N-acetyltransferase [Sulfurospirillaceae bacterium]